MPSTPPRRRPATTAERLRRALTALAVVVLMTACVPDGSAPAPKSGDGVLRTDLGPLTARVAGLDDATGVVWTSGTLGDGRAPGPSTYWIDAVVDLPAGDGARLRDLHGTSVTDAPQVVDALADALPAGPFESSPSLEDALSTDEWSVEHAHLDPAADRLVLQLVGE